MKYLKTYNKLFESERDNLLQLLNSTQEKNVNLAIAVAEGQPKKYGDIAKMAEELADLFDWLISIEMITEWDDYATTTAEKIIKLNNERSSLNRIDLAERNQIEQDAYDGDGNHIYTNRIPKGIKHLADILEELIIPQGGVSKLPVEIFELKNLRVFDISRNEITKFPKGFSKLKNLKILKIGNNDTANYPSDISSMSKLEVLNISHRDLKSIPNWVFKMSKLLELHVLDSNLTKIPKGVIKMKSLQKLQIFGNKITEIPTYLSSMDKLELINLKQYGDLITSVPVELAKMKSLKNIWLYASKWDTISIPKELKGIAKVKVMR